MADVAVPVIAGADNHLRNFLRSFHQRVAPPSAPPSAASATAAAAAATEQALSGDSSPLRASLLLETVANTVA